MKMNCVWPSILGLSIVALYTLIVCGKIIPHDYEVICVGAGLPKSHNDSAICTSVKPDLEFLNIHDNNNTLIVFTVPSFPLTKKVQLHNVSNVTIQGMMLHNTIIQCSSKNAGLSINNVVDVLIHGLEFSECGSDFTPLSSLGSNMISTRTAVLFKHCKNVKINNIAVHYSTGTAVVLYDCTGKVEITYSNFTNNYINDTMHESGGGGVYIESSDCYNLHKCNETENLIFNSNVLYNINYCNFTNNIRTVPKNMQSIVYVSNSSQFISRYGHGGGGLSIWTRGHSTNNTYFVRDCHFSGNEALYGGGLYFHYQQNSSLHNLSIVNTTFENNSAVITGGGIDVASIFTNTDLPKHVSVTFLYCNFIKNSAAFGGGTGIVSSLFDSANPGNSIQFIRCRWEKNKATFGLAFNMRTLFSGYSASDFFPKVSISNSVFTKNTYNSEDMSNSGIATLHSRVFPIYLSDNVTFESNEGSGIKLVDSAVFISQNSSVTFDSNIANFGAGISLIGFSTISLDSDVNLIFIDNTARFSGGAIYAYSIDEQPQGLCFLQPNTQQNLIRQPRPHFYFRNNTAMQGGHSLYVSSLKPCSHKVYCNEKNISIDIFQNCLGNFEFDGATIDTQVQTEGSTFDLWPNTSPEKSLHCTPGNQTVLPIWVLDEFKKKTMHEAFLVSIANPTSNITLSYPYTANNIVQFNGQPGDHGVLQLNSLNFKNLTLQLKVVLLECPPGFVNINNTCTCSAQLNDEHYESFLHCDAVDLTTYVSFGYWVGYVLQSKNNTPGENNLYTAVCPLEYCRQSYETNGQQTTRIKLPSVASKQLLDEFMCGSQKRTGILCGDCIDNNYSVYFHSWGYLCDNNDMCSYGFLFYLLSEILPVTIMFTVIIVFGIDFNSGKLNGLILFAQIVQSLSVKANGAILYRKYEKVLYDLLLLFYGPFNLNFFKIDSLSFCIFKGANFLTIVLMEFFTLIYSFVLVLLIAYLMRLQCCYKMHIACRRLGVAKTTSLTNGLAAFLIVCYSQATRLSFQVLTTGHLIGKGERRFHSTRVFRMGTLEFFTGVHIPFCIGAILLLLFIAIPSILLLIYPVLYKVIPVRLQKANTLKRVLNKLEKYRPLFDAFQGCFRDKHRYFAGIHFIYRSAFIASFAFISSRLIIFAVNQIIAMLMLSLHLWIQPYKQRMHNFLDGVLFLLVAIINMLTIWRYFLSFVQVVKDQLIIVGIVQLMLLYLPIASLVMYWIYKLLIFVLQMIQRKRKTGFAATGTSLNYSGDFDTSVGSIDHYRCDTCDDDSYYTAASDIVKLEKSRS